MQMSKNTSIVQFQHFINESWAFESGHLLRNHIKVLKVQVEGALEHPQSYLTSLSLHLLSSNLET